MIEWALTGGLVPVLLFSSGVFFLFYLRGYPFRAPRKMLCAMKGSGEGSGVSPFRAVTEALAGTLGVGNIVGVANAIGVGGAGAVLWMWVSALFACVLKYAETLLGVLHRRSLRDGRHYGGAYYYIKDHFLSRGRVRTAAVVSSVFALFTVLDALSMGCVIQVRAVASALQNAVALPPALIGALLLLATVPLLICGRHGISALTEYLVPVMTLGYLVLSFAVLILRRDALGEALSMIFTDAFRMESAVGGVLGFLTSRALRVGTMRGLLSNEAGCGTSPTAHAAANAASPAAQGVWGVFEVLVDTVLLCTVTAIAILVSPTEVPSSDGMLIAIRAYASVLGGGADLFFAASVACFGYATLLCWGGYGMEALRFLSRRKRWRALYLLVFSVCIFIGACSPSDWVWGVSDFAIAVLTSINVTVLLLSRREVRKESLAFAA